MQWDGRGSKESTSCFVVRELRSSGLRAKWFWQIRRYFLYSTLLTIQCLLWISFWRNDSSEMVSMRSFCYLQRTLGTSKLEAADLRWFFQAFERLIDGYWWVRWIMSGWWMPSRNANCLAESVANKRRAKLITNSIIESAGKCLRISRFVGSDESDQTKIYSLLGIYARQRPTKTTKEDSGTEI